MNFIRHLFPKRRVGLPAAALTVVAGLAFACSESPTEATLDGLAPSFKKCPTPGHPSCGGGEDPPPDPTVITATLAVLNPGVSSDGGDYDGDNVTDRFRLQPQCSPDGRSMSLFPGAATPSNPAPPVPDLADPSTCNGDQPGGGWVFIHLPDLLAIGANGCIGQPVDLPAAGVQCPFAQRPAFQVKTKGNGDVILQARGAFAPTAHYFVMDDNGERFDYVWQNAQVVVDGSSYTFTADEALLYVGHSFVCEGPNPSPEGEIDDGCTVINLPINIEVTVTP